MRECESIRDKKRSGGKANTVVMLMHFERLCGNVGAGKSLSMVAAKLVGSLCGTPLVPCSSIGASLKAVVLSEAYLGNRAR